MSVESRVPFIAGNWKMNKFKADAVALVKELNQGIADMKCEGVDVAVCPPSIYLDAVAAEVAESPVGLGAQNMYDKKEGEGGGAFTGELSAGMLLDIGCQYVILGHSERRTIFHETNEDVCLKVHTALEAGLTPIVCVGETLDQRKAGKIIDVVAEQYYGSLAGVSAEQALKVVLAYEPLWAINTGVTATPEQAEEVHGELRQLMKARYNDQVANEVRILYGGSVKPGNAGDLLPQPNIDGALVGGASLTAEAFLGIIEHAKSS